jgi:hypothetical protein
MAEVISRTKFADVRVLERPLGSNSVLRQTMDGGLFVGYSGAIGREHLAEQLDGHLRFAQTVGYLSNCGFSGLYPTSRKVHLFGEHALMNCRSGRRRQPDLAYAESFAGSKASRSKLRLDQRKSLRIRRAFGFDPQACTQFEFHVAVFFASFLRFLLRISMRWSSNQRRLTMSDLVVVTYPDEYRAAEVLAALQRLQEELLIDLEDAAYVTKEKDGKMKLHETVPLTDRSNVRLSERYVLGSVNWSVVPSTGPGCYCWRCDRHSEWSD